MLSVIVPTHNKYHRLKLALESWKNQTLTSSEFEFIVINDASTDGTKELLDKADFKMKVHHSDRPLGRSTARNLGAKISSGNILVFIDDDVLLDPDFLIEHDNHQKKLSGAIIHGRIYNIVSLKFFLDPCSGLLFPGVEGSERSVDKLKSNLISTFDVKNRFESISKKNRRLNQWEKLVNDIFVYGLQEQFGWLGFTGGNVSLPRLWFEQMDGFDENFGLHWGSEDIELGYRLALVGKTFCQLERACNFHMDHYRKNFVKEECYTSKYFYQKHPRDEIKWVIDYIGGKIKRRELLHYLREQKVVCNER